MRNIYPAWWDTTVTIHNKVTDAQTKIITWYRTVVHKCFWEYQRDKITVGQTVLESNKTICRIRKDTRFLPAFEYKNIPNDQKGEHFTLSKSDIIIKGEVDDVIDEYTNGSRSTDIIKKYKDLQGCIEINHVSINSGGGRVGMCEHYLAEGI